MTSLNSMSLGTARLLLHVVTAVMLLLPTPLTAGEMEQMQQQLQTLARQFAQCADDACRNRVQAALSEVIGKLNQTVEKQGASPLPPSMELPRAGNIDPGGESWQLQMEASWVSSAPNAIVRSRIAGQVTLEADRNGVFIGSGPLEAEVISSVPPYCQSEPLTGVADVEIGGLRDGDFLWIWVIPGTEIRAVGTMVCTVGNQTTSSQDERIIAPEQESMLVSPVLLYRTGIRQLVTSGNLRGTASTGGGGPNGEWQRMLRLIPVRPAREEKIARKPPSTAAADWLLEYHMGMSGSEQSGEVAFSVPIDNGPVRGVGPLRVEGHGTASQGRLILLGESKDGFLRFIPRAVLDDISGHGVMHRDLSQMFFNVLFHSGDHQVTLPLRDGAALSQGPATFKLHGPKNCKLSISSPKPNTRYRYSDASPGELTLQFKAHVQPAKFAKRITWTLPKFGAAKVEVIPKNAKGPKLTVRLKGLPKRNTGFGAKQVTASIRASACHATARRKVRLFFPRDAKNNPGGSNPNWFYYWSQTSARSGPAPKYGARKGHCAALRASNDPDGAGYYADNLRFALPRHYLICDLKKYGPKMKFEANIWEVKQVSATNAAITPRPQTLTGIDTFALASLHEYEHMTHLRRWWINPNGTPIKDRGKLDTDLDDIPDKVEQTLNNKYPTWVLKVGLKKSNSGIKDEEFYTQLVGHARFKKGAADREDWSYPGKQWPK